MGEIREGIIWYTIDERKEEILELTNYAEENEIEISERELTKLWNMGYEKGKIFKEGFLEKFSKVKDEFEDVIRRELKSWKSRKEKEVEINEEIEELDMFYKMFTWKGYEIERSDIKRLFRLGFGRYELIADGFIRKYLEDR